MWQPPEPVQWVYPFAIKPPQIKSYYGCRHGPITGSFIEDEAVSWPVGIGTGSGKYKGELNNNFLIEDPTYRTVKGKTIKGLLSGATTTAESDLEPIQAAGQLEPGHCFIATAAYGTPWAAELEVLRRWRDEALLPSSLGRGLVSMYYRCSPLVADFIRTREGLRALVRRLLTPVVNRLREVR